MRVLACTVLQIAFDAHETGHTQLLGVLYDELVREHWGSMSTKVRRYKVKDVVAEGNDKILKKAQALHEKLLGGRPAKDEHAKGSGKGARQATGRNRHGRSQRGKSQPGKSQQPGRSRAARA